MYHSFKRAVNVNHVKIKYVKTAVFTRALESKTWVPIWRTAVDQK